MPKKAVSHPKRRVLYIHPDTMGLPDTPERNALHHLSPDLTGDYLAVWWGPEDPTERARAANAINEASGDFRFHWNRSYKLPQGARQLWDLAFYVGKALQLSIANGGYDVIVAYGPYRTGLAGYILKVLTRAKLILEMPGNPEKSLNFEPGLVNRLKRWLGPAMVRFLVKRSDHIWLRYPTQLGALTPDDTSRLSVFPSFVPIRSLRPAYETDRFILFIGHPWYLKGVDILIRAFNKISEKHPDVRLVVMGHCPDRTPYLELAAGNPKIEFYPGTPHPQAMQVMARCTIFVLPSRTDAMARVLIEAMATQKPIVASSVDGTPYYVKDGERGLLFTSESIDELADRLDVLLSDPELAGRLASNAHAYAHENLGEDSFAETFKRMVERAMGVGGPPPVEPDTSKKSTTITGQLS